MCVDDLEPFKEKAERWEKTGQKKSWHIKAAHAVHMYIRDRDLEEIHELISRHVSVKIYFRNMILT